MKPPAREGGTLLIFYTCYCIHMLTRRLQILLDERRYERLASYAAEKGLSVGAAVRQAIDEAIPAASSERAAAARRILDADGMPVPEPDALRRELDEVRAARA
jgi:hypothetical protein